MAPYTLGNQAKTQKAEALEDMLETRVRQQHNMPDFEQATWVTDMHDMRPFSRQSIEKQRLGICTRDVHATRMRVVKKGVPIDIDEVTKGKHKSARQLTCSHK